MNRRDLVQSLPLLASALTTAAHAQAAKPDCKETELTECKGFPFEEMPVRHSSDGAKTRQFMEGQMPGLNIVEVHETTIAPGRRRILRIVMLMQSSFWCVRGWWSSSQTMRR
jgi:hypothetical protein